MGGRAAIALAEVGRVGPTAAGDEAVSKYLSWVLRHGADQLGLMIRADGFVRLTALLNLPYFSTRGLGEGDVQGVLDRSGRNRFAIRAPPGEREPHIRAHQGHTLRKVADGSLLDELPDAAAPPVLCHGTTSLAWASIQGEGLRAMGRNCIHCATEDLALPESRARRGHRYDVVVYLDAAAAMAAGVALLRSEGGDVLTRGLGGTLPRTLL